MKTKVAFASLLFALGFGGLAASASARTDVDVDINIGVPPPPAIIIGGRDHDRYEHRHYGRGRDRDYGRHHGPRGYWKEVRVKTYVPGRWVITCDRYGREIRVRERGHYEYRTERVWVEGRRRGYDDCDR
jgi:hypothetical protein